MARQFYHDRRPFRTFEIDADAALAAVVIDVGGRLSIDPGRKSAATRVFAAGRHFQLNHLGTEISENPS